MPEQILGYLKDKGERLDYEIAAGIGRPLASVKAGLDALVANGEIVVCQSVRFSDGERIEGLRCRLASYVPLTRPGRRSY